MEETIFSENRKLKRKLDNLIRRARTNEQKQELFDSFGFEIIAANTPAQLRDYILFQMQDRFQLQDVIMCIIDFEHDAEKLFYGYDVDAQQLPESKLLILDMDCDQSKIASLPRFPILGPKVLKQYDWMLECAAWEVINLCQSAVLLPLIRSDQLIGTLLLLSRDENRYQPGIATNFLQKLSAMTAVAIENCLNQQRLKEIGYQDPLTQAYNRRYFDLRFADEIERSLRKDENFACMFLDVDFFKNVNDTYGHHIGDMVLTRLVVLIKDQVRACDIVARYGGEEFVVVLPGVNAEGALDIAERLRKAVENDSLLGCGHGVKITVSIGLETLCGLGCDGRNLQAKEISLKLLDNADKALYKAKSMGRNQVLVYQCEE
ncbi:diguanylate cyclase (GGDEF domain), partial [hydrothermal vent metagenome]